MKLWCRSVAFSLFCWFLLGGPAEGQAPSVADANKSTLWYVPHTHWEGAVFKTREEYLEMGLPIILRALNTLKRQPGYKFTLDQAALVKPFLDRYPRPMQWAETT